jgi:formylglycine-generating enzyme required for sulfatase activity
LSLSLLVSDLRGERPYRIDDLPLTIGGRGADITLSGHTDGPPVAYIGMAAETPFIQPRTDQEAVYLNNIRLEASRWLQHGDVIRIDNEHLVCDISEAHIGFSLTGPDTDDDTLPPLIVEPSPAPPPPALSPEASPDSIQPIAYQPPDRGAAKGARRFGPRSALFVVMLVLVSLIGGFLFTAKSVKLEVTPAADRVTVRGAWIPIDFGGRYLLRPGPYTIVAEKSGYHVAEHTIEVTDAQNQMFSLQLEKLPGLLSVISRPVDGARILIDDKEIGVTPLSAKELRPGPHEVIARAENYLEYHTVIDIEGEAIRQNLEIDLIPGWAQITFNSVPTGARVWVNGEDIGSTPLSADLREGEYTVRMSLAGFKTWQDQLRVMGNQPQILPEVSLEKADGLLAVSSNPKGANVTVDGTYQGQTPIEIALPPEMKYRIELSKAGYHSTVRDVTVEADETQRLTVRLKSNQGVIRVISHPSDAEVYVDGVSYGRGNPRLKLAAVPHMLEIKRKGYAPYKVTVTPRPGFDQEVTATLKTLARREAERWPAVIKTSSGYELKLIKPGRFSMGASRREQGRRANEVRYTVQLTRPFYMGTHELTNAQFREFQPTHSSGIVRRASLDLDNLPVVKVTWEQAARYCNWLSQKESLTPVYVEKQGKLMATVPITNGYRLPTEAEWAWVARYAGGSTPRKYPWGQSMPPPKNSGNYADKAAENLVADRLESYDDGYAATAPTGTYQANPLGLFDLGGNVAEWAHDYYSIRPQSPSELAKDPTGPAQGKYHVIRGSSWKHASISELRLSYRDYADDARPDVGFRVARYAE